MAAIVTVFVTGQEAFEAFIAVTQNEGIRADELGQNSGIYQVVFSSSEVEMGTGFDTLHALMAQYSPAAVAGLSRAPFG